MKLSATIGKASTLLAAVLCLLQACIAASASADSLPVAERNRISGLISALVPFKAGSAFAVQVVDLSSSETVFSHNGAVPLKPASVLKLLSSATALDALGPDYRFETEVLAEGISPGAVETLYIRGGGDPGLTSESLWIIARSIYKRGVRSIGAVILDSTLFDGDRNPSGQRAYETGSSALSYNYNSISIEVCPGVKGANAIVTVDPWELGLAVQGTVKTTSGKTAGVSADLIERKGQLPQISVSGSLSSAADCQVIYRSFSRPEHSFGMTLIKTLERLGIRVPHSPQLGAVPQGARLLYRHRSEALSRIVQDLNHFSTNFIAEQLLFAIGGYGSDGKLRREEGLLRMKLFLQKLGVPAEQFELHDASGLSHSNRISAGAIAKVLQGALRDPAIGPELEASLSFPGRTGTLRKRNFNGLKGTVRAKTGSINGVSSLAGYVTTRSGRKVAFVILNNAAPDRDKAMQLEEKIVAVISDL